MAGPATGPQNTNPIGFGSQGGMISRLDGSCQWKPQKEMVQQAVNENAMRGYF